MSEQQITVEQLYSLASDMRGTKARRDFIQALEKFAAQQRADATQQLQRENERAMSEASHLALSIWITHYQKESPNFELCDSVAGVISQIDNMVCGLFAELAAAKAQTDNYRKSYLDAMRELGRASKELADESRKLKAAKQQLAEAEKDAERYRWLRDQHKKHLGLTICKVGMWDLTPWSGDDPDSAIDAARTAQAGENGNGN